MKTFIAAAALTVLASAAYAGEGQGDPFPFRAPTQPYSLDHYKQAAGVAQNPYPFTVPGAPMNTANVVPPVGAAGEVQSLNSMPPGFEDGTALAQNLHHITPSPTQMAQPARAPTSTHG